MFEMCKYFIKKNFHRDVKKYDRLTPQCKPCRKIYRKISKMNIMMKKILDVENEEWKIKQNKIEKYRCDNREKTIENVKNKKESDLNFKLACNLRSGTSSAFNCQKTNETFDLNGCSHSFFGRCIVHQLW